MLFLRPGLEVVEGPAEQLALRSAHGEVPVGPCRQGFASALRSLASRGATEDELSDIVLATDGAAELARLYYWVGRWRDNGLLCYGVRADRGPIATVIPITHGFRLSLPGIDHQARFRLSRFAYCRREAEHLVLESPLAEARLLVHGPIGAAVIAELVQPRSFRELSASVDELSDCTARSFMSLLQALAMAVSDDVEDRDGTLAQWEFHDLLFHSRSRPGMHDFPIGATFRFAGTMSAPPALKARMSADVVPLAKPAAGRDAPLTRVMENRRSIRQYGRAPITATQLGEFLFRTVRARRVLVTEPAPDVRFEVSTRPYPSAGAAYEIEVYLAVNHCAGLAAGLYHYEPLNHVLCKLADRNEHVDTMLRDAQLAGALSGEPQVLITLTSRFQRLSWKYSGLAYATTLKNVGVLFQSMYLVATAMKLAPCALGSGNAALFAKAAGLDRFIEASVGDFLVGSAPSCTSGRVGRV